MPAALRAAGAIALLGASLIGVREAYTYLMRSELDAKVLARPNLELERLHSEEEAKLGSYRWASKKDGVLLIPLARAKQLTLADYQTPAKRAP
jgi:hypothetical protein